MDDVHLNHHVLVHEVSRSTVVGDYTSHFGGRKEYIFWFLGSEERFNFMLAGQIQLRVSAEY
jgi:hypothetical protein